METKNVECSLNRVAEFRKVSYKQFLKDWKDVFGDNYSDDEIAEIYDRIRKPERGTRGSAGYDFFTPITIALEPGETIKIPTGIKVGMLNGYVLTIFPRSGLGFKYGCRLSNTVGIIDSDYVYSDNEGHIMVKLINDSSIKKTIEIPAGTGMAQGIFLPYGITFDDNATTERNGGFGSTTKGE